MENFKRRGFKNGIKERRFFERVIFEKKGSEDTLIDWIYWLEDSKKIRIERFMQLLWEIGEISFPIKIKGHIEQDKDIRFRIVDAVEKQFNLKIEKFSTRFIVTRYDPEEEEKWRLGIEGNASVKVLEYYHSRFVDNSELEIEKIETGMIYNKEKNIIKIIILNNAEKKAIFEFDAGKVGNEKYIFNVIKEVQINNYCTVYYLFVQLRNLLENPDSIISIKTFIGDDKFAEIDITDGYVTKEIETRMLYNRSQTERKSLYIQVEDYIRKLKYKCF